ncbi:hypothetical protein RND81_10G131000 [Saponaria officinalis]|uniref:Ternary complex factor MIP1 leucine-zipper domain-containing protein n=1 Tax=Saponaria officinalis TaxID=3572 RepID=A0AAW1I1H3_SAPOF
MTKFEDFLVPSSQHHNRRIALEEEVEELQQRLNGELQLNSVLQYALKGPVLSYPSLSSILPLKVQMLLAELEMVEKEIACLETRLEKLKLNLYREQQLDTEVQRMQSGKHLQMQLPCRQQNQGERKDISHHRRRKSLEGRLSLGSITDLQTCTSASFREQTEYESPGFSGTKQSTKLDDDSSEEPNLLSEELLMCLIEIFLKMKQRPSRGDGAANSKHTPLCINSRGISSKTPFSCKARSHSTIDNTSSVDSYDLLNSGSKAMSARPNKKLTQITRSSLTTTRISDSYPAIRKLRVLLNKLCYVDLTFLSHKQKLAFWINICNACIMHAYLQHGLPSTQETMLTLLNKAALNVGGIVLNALAIEHYLLRHPIDSEHGPTDEKEVLLRRAYGLQYPEPNITFALCRGNWSSPALSVYNPDEVVNQLSQAKVEYLEAFVKVTSKKKILVPKLLQWHMQDFADDIESLIEWIYSQLPPKGLLKTGIMECLKESTKIPAGKMIEIIPYEYEFRYLLALPH